MGSDLSGGPDHKFLSGQVLVGSHIAACNVSVKGFSFP